MKGVEDFFKPKPLFFTPNCQKVHEKETTQTHTKERPTTNVFPQHHKKLPATSIIMFASSFNAVRSSPSIISKNVSSKSSRSSSNRSSTVKVRAMGMKKGSLLFSFSSSRVVIHLISTRLVFKNGCCFFLFSSFDEDDETRTMNKDRYRSVYVEYDERNDAGRSDRDDRQQQRLFSSSLICFCLSAPFFRIYNRSRLKHLSKNAAEKTT